jgi:hypothetical protein
LIYLDFHCLGETGNIKLGSPFDSFDQIASRPTPLTRLCCSESLQLLYLPAAPLERQNSRGSVAIVGQTTILINFVCLIRELALKIDLNVILLSHIKLYEHAV